MLPHAKPNLIEKKRALLNSEREKKKNEGTKLSLIRAYFFTASFFFFAFAFLATSLTSGI